MPDQVWIADGTQGLKEVGAGKYARERDLQSLLLTQPAILGRALDPVRADANLLLVDEELPIRFSHQDVSTTWRLDLLFVDAGGMPTLVEVKRSSDSRIRRDVLGQLIEYAASFSSGWTTERLLEHIERTGRDQFDAFMKNSDLYAEADDFWEAVRGNLESGRLRLVFVADLLPPRLVHTIEYLNNEIENVEVVGVEVAPYRFGASDQEDDAFIVTTRGVTWKAEQKRDSQERRSREEFDAVLLSRRGPQTKAGFDEFCGQLRELGFWESVGTSKTNPQLFFNFTNSAGETAWPLGIKPKSDKLALQMRPLSRRSPFTDEAVRSEYLTRIEAVVGRELESRNTYGYPGFPVSLLAEEAMVEPLINVMRWWSEAFEAGTAE